VCITAENVRRALRKSRKIREALGMINLATKLPITLVVASFALIGCATVTDFLTPAPQAVVCQIEAVPTLPVFDEVSGTVTLDAKNIESLLLYIESLESCADKVR